MSMYTADWHQCTNCGLTRPDSELTKGMRRDVVLNMNETIFCCTDSETCARFKQMRDERAQRELAAEQAKVAAALIKPLASKKRNGSKR